MSGNKTSFREVGLNIRTQCHASPKVGQDQLSQAVSIPCRHATPVADVILEPDLSYKVKIYSGKCNKKVMSWCINVY